MKEADAKVDHPHQMLLYVEKPDGSYGTVQTGSYMAYNFLDDFQEKQRYFHETYSSSVLQGKISPIAYFMKLQELTVPEVAERTRLSAGRVRRHMSPKHFASLSIGLAQRYAELFGIPVVKLFAFINPTDPGIQVNFQPSANKAVCSITITPRKP